jgi:hypothetical protein
MSLVGGPARIVRSGAVEVAVAGSAIRNDLDGVAGPPSP